MYRKRKGYNNNSIISVLIVKQLTSCFWSSSSLISSSFSSSSSVCCRSLSCFSFLRLSSFFFSSSSSSSSSSSPSCGYTALWLNKYYKINSSMQSIAYRDRLSQRELPFPRRPNYSYYHLPHHRRRRTRRLWLWPSLYPCLSRWFLIPSPFYFRVA